MVGISDGGDFVVPPCHLHNHVAVAGTRLGIPQHVRKPVAVRSAAGSQCRAAPKCGKPVLAQELFLDADRREFRAVDDRAIPVDVL